MCGYCCADSGVYRYCDNCVVRSIVVLQEQGGLVYHAYIDMKHLAVIYYSRELQMFRFVANEFCAVNFSALAKGFMTYHNTFFRYH